MIERYNPKENYSGEWPMYKSRSGKWIHRQEYEKLEMEIEQLKVELIIAYSKLGELQCLTK